jgi:hypothetical protein
MSIDERRLQDIFQELLETSEKDYGDVETRENTISELSDMFLLTQQLRALGQQEMEGAQASLNRTRERVLQSISAPELAHAAVVLPKESIWERWRRFLTPAMSFAPTAALVGLTIILVLGVTLYASGRVRQNNPQLPLASTSGKVSDTGTTEHQIRNVVAVGRDWGTGIQPVSQTSGGIEIPYVGTVQDCDGNTCVVGELTLQLPAELAESLALKIGEQVTILIRVIDAETEGDMQLASLPPTVQIPTSTLASAKLGGQNVKPLPLTRLPVAGAPLGDFKSSTIPAPPPSGSPVPMATPPVIVLVLPTAAPSTLAMMINESGTDNAWSAPIIVAGAHAGQHSVTSATIAQSLSETPNTASSVAILTLPATVASTAPSATTATYKAGKKPVSTNKPAQKRKPTPKRSQKKHPPTTKTQAKKKPTSTSEATTPTSAPTQPPTKEAAPPTIAIVMAPTATREISGPALIAGASAPQKEKTSATNMPQATKAVIALAPETTQTDNNKNTPQKEKKKTGKIASATSPPSTTETNKLPTIQPSVTAIHSKKNIKSVSGKIRRVHKVKGKVKAVLIGRYWYNFTSKTVVNGKIAVGKRARVKYHIYNKRRYASSISTTVLKPTPSKGGKAQGKKTPIPKLTATPKPDDTTATPGK